jgi:hypothetical protein
MRHRIVVLERLARDLTGYASFLDRQDAVRQRGDKLKILFDQNDADAIALLDPQQGLDNLFDDRWLYATNVVDEYEGEVGLTVPHILDQPLQFFPTIYPNAAATVVGIGADDSNIAMRRIGGDSGPLNCQVSAVLPACCRPSRLYSSSI